MLCINSNEMIAKPFNQWLEVLNDVMFNVEPKAINCICLLLLPNVALSTDILFALLPSAGAHSSGPAFAFLNISMG